MLLNGPEWVTRRVERVQFIDDRAATRRVSMDFLVPSQAPCYHVAPREHVRLIPLTVMRRKTLVNFGVADVNGQALSLMSMRHTQALTYEMICVLADITLRKPYSDEVQTFAKAIASGTQSRLIEAWKDATASTDPDSDLYQLMNDEAASRMIRRLADNFVLLVTVNEDGPARRILRFAYDEPLSLRYVTSRFDQSRKTLNRAAPPAPSKDQRASRTGREPTAIRFPVPAAEYTLSYHFEIEAPPGAVITEASLVAGRPGPDEHLRLSWDHVAGGRPVVGLHAVDVPNGSISGVQVLLRPSSRGWLFTNALAAALTLLVLVATVAASFSGTQSELVVAGAIFAISAAFIVFVVQPGEHQMVSRLVANVRYAMATLVGLLVLAGLLIIILSGWVAHGTLIALCVIAFPFTFLILGAYRRAWRAHAGKETVHRSPWEQGVDIDDGAEAVLDPEFESLEQAHERFGFYGPAIMVQTAEGEHLEDPWTDRIDSDLKTRLKTWAPIAQDHDTHPSGRALDEGRAQD